MASNVPSREELVRTYYRHLDAGHYEKLGNILAADFVHDRQDMTLEGRDQFISFMRDDRPRTDTRHEVYAIYEGIGGSRMAVEGEVALLDGGHFFSFFDRFTFDTQGDLAHLRTYTRSATHD